MDALKNIKHIFFTGIGGAGMSGIADILLDSGYQVSGSDRELTETTRYLSTKGAAIHQGHDPSNIKDIDLLVYSSAIPESNSERQEAKKLGIKQIRRAEMLAIIIGSNFNIAISGTHGKTTTTALCAQILIDGGKDPTVIIGGKYKNLQTNARLGRGKIFVTEADEFDRSFLTLSPTIAVVTTIEEDHLDCYKDLSDIQNTFLTFIKKVPVDGKIICCIEDEGVRSLIEQLNRSVVTYGFSDQANYRATDLNFNELTTTFCVEKGNEDRGKIKLQIPGRHNVLNALAGYVVGDLLHIPSDTISQALYHFRGVERRFEKIGQVNKIDIFDDYAHHPTEVMATLISAKEAWNQNVIVVFQPHLYSRTRDFAANFAKALSPADEVILADIYPAREKPIPGVSSDLIIHEAQKKNYSHFRYIPDKAQIESELLKQSKPGDMIITMGAGDIWTVAKNLIKLLEEKYLN